MGDDIHRGSEVTRLTRAIEQAPKGLSIVGLSGLGGVGKTFLLSHVLETIAPEKNGYLVLVGDAANPDTRGDFFGIVEGQLFRRNLAPPADRAKDYFPHLRDLAEAHRQIVAEALGEMTKTGAPENVKRAATVLLRAGRILNQTVSKSTAALEALGITDDVVEQSLDVAWDLVRNLRGLRDATLLPGPLRDLLGVTRRNRIKRDLYAVTAAEVRTDLAAALVGYETKDSRRATHGRIVGVDKLILVIDDYEATHGLLGDFLIGALVPELAGAPFKTVLIVVGRDDLETTHPGWAQHCRRYLREQIRLAPFDMESAHAMFAAASIPRERWAALFEATQGYPFLISLAVEEAVLSVDDSVVFLRRFYDRTTRWMTDREREWFTRICYLDRVDEDTLSRMFPDQSTVKIQDWFEREPSVRDPAAPYFRVRPMIREKMLRYLEVRSPTRHRELTARAAA
jgi:hypothetical protein